MAISIILACRFFDLLTHSPKIRLLQSFRYHSENETNFPFVDLERDKFENRLDGVDT